MQGAANIKFATAQQAKQIYQYKKIKGIRTKLKQRYGITKHAINISLVYIV